MPVYRYQCLQCYSEQEHTHSAEARVKLACDACGGILKKALSLGVTIHPGGDAVVVPLAHPNHHHCTSQCTHHHHPNTEQGCVMDLPLDELVSRLEG